MDCSDRSDREPRSHEAVVRLLWLLLQSLFPLNVLLVNRTKCAARHKCANNRHGVDDESGGEEFVHS